MSLIIQNRHPDADGLRPLSIAVSRSTRKLGIAPPKSLSSRLGFDKDAVVRLTLKNENGTAVFLALWREWIGIPRAHARKLRLCHGKRVYITDIRRVPYQNRPSKLITNGKIDLLCFVPLVTDHNYAYVVDEYQGRGVESWMRLWYFHNRGSARQVEIKRYVDPRAFASLLGQYQAEGDKSNQFRAAFTNSLVSEHAEFVSSLTAFGLARGLIRGRCVYNPNKIEPREIEKLAESYRKATGVVMDNPQAQTSMKGARSFVTLVRSRIVKDLVDEALKRFRQELFKPIGEASLPSELIEDFASKLLTGDGTLDVRVRNRTVATKIRVVDRSKDFRKSYRELMVLLGFKAKINDLGINVSANCNFANLLTLYRIRAFLGTRNWPKLLCGVELSLCGRINASYEKLRRLSVHGRFTSRNVTESFGIGRRGANCWIQKMVKRGMMRQTGNIRGNGYVLYEITDAGRQLARLLNKIHKDYDILATCLGQSDPRELLERLKDIDSYNLAGIIRE